MSQEVLISEEKDEELKEKLLEQLRKLVAFKTTADNPEELKAIIDHVESQLKPLGVKLSRYEVNGKHSLVATVKDEKEPTVMMVAHLDVVNAPEEMFELKEEGDILRGRGVLDMKGPAAVVIELFKLWANENPEASLGLMLTTDEEVGSENGVRYLLEEESWRAKVAIIPDGGEGFHVVTKNKGALHLKANVRGKAAHGSTPWLGENAIDKAFRFYREIRSLLHGAPAYNPQRWYNTVNLGKISGGDKVNMVADSCTIELDIRFVKPFTLQEIRNTVETVAKRFEIEVEYTTATEPVEVDMSSEYIEKFLKAYEEILNMSPILSVEHGATDARHFTELNIPVIMIYPQGGEIHAPGEWVSLNSLIKLYKMFDRYLQMVL